MSDSWWSRGVVGVLVLCACTSTPNAAGVLRADAVVLYKGDETDEETLARCQAFGECSGLDRVSVADAVREGSSLYVLLRTHLSQPLLLVSRDEGATWEQHALPPSFDMVEGVADGDPGAYMLVPWQGRLYLLVEAITLQARFHYWAPSLVDLSTNTYSVRSAHLAGSQFIAGGQALSATTEGANIFWQRYDFTTDTGTTWQLVLGPTDVKPWLPWTSADGRTLVSLSEPTGPAEEQLLCHHTLDTAVDGGALTTLCTSRLRVPLAPGVLGTATTQAVPHGGEVWRLAPAGDGSRLVGLVARGGQAVVGGVFDLGPGAPAIEVAPHPRYGDFLQLGASTTTTDTSRLVRVTPEGSVEDVHLPRTPCEGGGVCGVAGAGSGGYGTARWLMTLEGGDVLAFHLVNQRSPGLRPLLVMTRDRPTFTAFDSMPLATAPLPEVPDAKPAGALEQQCARAAACRAFSGLRECQAYWSTVRHGPGGADLLYAAFLAVPPTSCDFGAAFADRRQAADGGAVPCVPGCDGEWATFGCAPWGSANLLPRMNCAAVGAQCLVDAAGRGTCGVRAMAAGECDTCQGSLAVACLDQPVPSVLDCAALGGTCTVELGHATCAWGSCSAGGRYECQGDVSVACGAAPARAVSEAWDCGRLTQPCTAGVRCVTTAPSCAIGDGLRCDDGLLAWCDGSSAVRFLDCRALGFSGCVQARGSSPGVPTASCVR